MLKNKTCWVVFFALMVMVAGNMPIFAQQVPNAPTAIRDTLKGMDIVIGNWWNDYNPNTYKPKDTNEEKLVDYHKRLLQQYGFTMQQRKIAEWQEIPEIAAISINAGKPAASVFVLQPDWALDLYRQNLLYPVSTRSSVNWNAVTPVEWNKSVTNAFTFNNKAYAFAAGYGESVHATCVFFNKRLFREAGLDPNLPYDLQKNGQWTWDKFLEISKKLTRDINNDRKIDIYAMPHDLSTEILDAFVSSNKAMYIDRDKNGKLVNASDRPEFADAVRFFMKLRDEGVMMSRPEDSEWNWHISAFNNGKVAMFIDQQYQAVYDLKDMKDDWEWFCPPKAQGPIIIPCLTMKT